MKAFRYLPTILYLGALALLVLDSYGSNTKVLRYLHVPSYILMIDVIAILIWLRISLHQGLLSLLEKFNTFFLLPVTVMASIVLTLINAMNNPNYIFSLTHLQPAQILLLSIFSTAVFVLSRKNKWFVDNLYPCIFLGAFVYLGFAALAALLPFDVFLVATREDGFVEYLQFAMLLICAVFAGRVGYVFHKQGRKLQTGIFVLLTLAFIFVAGDEISWGQRLLDIQTPGSIVAYNTQGEITVHNLSVFHSLVDWGYLIIGFIGVSMWTIPSLRSYLHFAPSSYFLLGFLYNLYTLSLPLHVIGRWSESAELMLYTGIMFTLLLIAFGKVKALAPRTS